MAVCAELPIKGVVVLLGKEVAGGKAMPPLSFTHIQF